MALAVSMRNDKRSHRVGLSIFFGCGNVRRVRRHSDGLDGVLAFVEFTPD